MSQRYAIKEKDDHSSVSGSHAMLSEKADEFINYIVSI